MQNILIIGAGKSAFFLIDYLIEKAVEKNWQIRVGDINIKAAQHKVNNRANATAIAFDFMNATAREENIRWADIVVSMLPAVHHIVIAKDCLHWKKHLVTPSYISDAMKEMNDEVKKNDLIFLNEIGLDPGIDHLSAIEIFDKIKQEGGEITSFKSHCGGLVAKACDNNLWHYKFSWNPRNVILAGQGTAAIKWREKNAIQEISYEQLFATAYTIDLDDAGCYESYPNRDSLKYDEVYGLQNAATIYRGTLRVPNFCSGWQWLVENGMTAQSTFNYTDLLQKIANEKNETIRAMLVEIGFDSFIPTQDEKAADYLQRVLEQKWKMQPDDTDLVVMIHEVAYSLHQKKYSLSASLVLEGEDAERTAMAKTVGLPLAIAVEMILDNTIAERGVILPITKEIVYPMMAKLKSFGIEFYEKTIEL